LRVIVVNRNIYKQQIVVSQFQSRQGALAPHGSSHGRRARKNTNENAKMTKRSQKTRGL
jgi:hypothetical protein